MLPSCEVIEAVASKIEEFNLSQLVVDPVMVSRAGAKLIDDDAIALLRKLLIPQAAIITPNRYEAQILSGMKVDSLDELKQAAIAIYEELGAKVVLAKGGGLLGADRGTDIWYDGRENQSFTPAGNFNSKYSWHRLYPFSSNLRQFGFGTGFMDISCCCQKVCYYRFGKFFRYWCGKWSSRSLFSVTK